MQNETPHPSTNESSADNAFWRRLLHRWLVQYNPLYLLSAALVLGGVTAISQELALANSLYGQVSVAAIAEVYAWALIGGAALLTRIQLRRPAVLLALLTVLYQGDLTLHTETCAYLGGVGIFASIAWLAMFVAKLHALAWALKLRLSKSAVIIPTLGAAGLTAIPYLFQLLDRQALSVVVSLWLFGLGAAGLWTRKVVSSKVSLDPWATSVLHRATKATWVLWAVLAMVHVWFWSSEGQLSVAPLIPVGLLLATRWSHRERSVWSLVSATLVLVALVMPAFFWITALMASGALLLRALRQPTRVRPPSEPPPAEPYRTHPGHTGLPRPVFAVSFRVASADERKRLLAGAVVGLYLSVWTAGWAGGSWPEHILLLDALLTLICATSFWKWRMRIAFVPLLATYAHLSVQTGFLTVPQSTLAWGATAVGAGFVLLAGSLATSWHLQQSRRE